jgi:hypothetical protein
MDKHQWLERVKTSEFKPFLSAALDVIEPLGPFGAQLLWVSQPLISIFGAKDAVSEIAQAIETPEGIARLRQLLDED